jgi:guanylate cyclase soluble subunit alpha
VKNNIEVSENEFGNYKTFPFLSFFFRYRITPVAPSGEAPEEVDADDDDADVITGVRDVTSTSLSRSAADLRMGVASFCKAFPWHFVMDRHLEMVQLGAGFMQLFARDLRTLGTSVATYFEFRRPRGIALCFNEIVKRANTPFVLSIRWPDSTAEERLAEVSDKVNYNTK